MNSFKHEKGFTLIEILIALSLAVFGLLAIFSLIMGSLKSQQQSEFKRNAVIISGIIADKMRANTENAARYDSFGFVDPVTKQQVNRIDRTALASSSALTEAIEKTYKPDNYTAACDGVADLGTCSEDQIALNDMIFWQSVIQDTLPTGMGMVRRVRFNQNGAEVPTQNLYQIMIMWFERPSVTGQDAPLDPECNFPTVEEKQGWGQGNAPDPDESFRNFRCQVITVSI